MPGPVAINCGVRLSVAVKISRERLVGGNSECKFQRAEITSQHVPLAFGGPENGQIRLAVTVEIFGLGDVGGVTEQHRCISELRPEKVPDTVAVPVPITIRPASRVVTGGGGGGGAGGCWPAAAALSTITATAMRARRVIGARSL